MQCGIQISNAGLGAGSTTQAYQEEIFFPRILFLGYFLTIMKDVRKAAPPLDGGDPVWFDACLV